jgi:DNA-binding transcriptional regulator YiaG
LTPEKLHEIMHRLDFSTADVGTVMGIHRRTVQFWLAGKSPVPLAAAMLLEGIYEGLLPMEWVEEKILASLRIA